MNPQLQLRVIVVAPPADVVFAVQRGRAGLLAPARMTPDSLVFEFAVTVADAAAQPVRLTGEFTQGPATARFVYVNSGTYAGEAGSCWSRRAKLPLAGIPSALVQSALQNTAVIEARIAGTGRDGGPACASVPLLSGWTIV
jgi:hypothetical protein